MLIYKGFIKVTNYGMFYPISRIIKLSPAPGWATKTQIFFDDNTFITVDYPMIKLMDMLNGEKE